MDLQSQLDTLIKDTEANTSYKFGKVELKTAIIRGRKVGFATAYKQGAKEITGRIVLDSRFTEKGDRAEVINTLKHELAHLIAETVNTKKKAVWHGQAWKDAHIALGGNGERYYSGSFVKPENEGKEFKTLDELRKIKPTQPADTWERGTFRQWLERGYHVIKGQKGSLQVWQFQANEYETEKDGKSSKWGRASAFYFTPDQVEPNA